MLWEGDDLIEVEPTDEGGQPTGYPRDPDGEAEGSPLLAKNLWKPLGMINRAISALGGTPSQDLDGLADAVLGAGAVKASPLALSGESSELTRAIVCGWNCSITNSGVVVSGQDCTIPGSGNGSVIAASMNSDAWGAMGVIAGSDYCINSGGLNALLGSWNAELKTPYSIGGGYSADSISKTDANTNLTWLIRSNGGHAHFAGSLAVGGDVDTMTGGGFTADSSGNVVVGGNLVMTAGYLSVSGTATATGGVIVDYATGGSNESNPWGVGTPVTRDGPSGSARFYLSGGATWGTGVNVYQTVLNSSVGADSLVFVNARCSGAGATLWPINCGVLSRSAGQFTVWATAPDTITDPDLTWEWHVVNPVAP